MVHFRTHESIGNMTKSVTHEGYWEMAKLEAFLFKYMYDVREVQCTASSTPPQFELMTPTF